jgi:hypothetical protein
MISRLYRYLLLPSLALAVVVSLGCGAGESEDQARQAFEQGGSTLPEGHPPISNTPSTGAPAGPGSVAGLAWTAPDTWQSGSERPMRAATYMISPVEGDPEAGEVAVFYFGASQGGDVQSNVDRWIGQFEQPDGSDSKSVAKSGSLEVNGLKVTTVEVSGTYTAGMGPMSGVKSNKENFRMLGAIVEGPEGAVFFKFTGPQKTVESARSDFDKLIKSVSKM